MAHSHACHAHIRLLSHHTVVCGSMVGILSLLCVCLCDCKFVRLRISQRRKKQGAWNFACVLAYYELRLAGSHGGGGIASGMNSCYGTTASEHGMIIRNWGRQRPLRPYGGICVTASLLTHLLICFAYVTWQTAILRCGTQRWGL